MRIAGYRRLPKPDAALRDVLGITPEWLAQRGLRAVILDVDNTLGAYTEREMSREMQEHLHALAQRGVAVAVVSNAAEKRVRRFAGDFPYIARSGKPSPAALLEMARRLGAEPGQVAMVGDQLLTDIAAGECAGMVTVWVEPLSNNWALDLFFRLRRRMEKRIAYKGEKRG